MANGKGRAAELAGLCTFTHLQSAVTDGLLSMSVDESLGA
jgi:hypothetical protein